MKLYDLQILVALLLILTIGCSEKNAKNQRKANKNYTQYVDPFIGTGEHGHTYPGAAFPFGNSPERKGCTARSDRLISASASGR